MLINNNIPVIKYLSELNDIYYMQPKISQSPISLTTLLIRCLINKSYYLRVTFDVKKTQFVDYMFSVTFADIIKKNPNNRNRIIEEDRIRIKRHQSLSTIRKSTWQTAVPLVMTALW